MLDDPLNLSLLHIIGHDNASISSHKDPVLVVRAGTPPLELQGLTLNGQVTIEGGTVEIAGCHFDGSTFGSASSDPPGRRLTTQPQSRALSISGGHVSILGTSFQGLPGGAVEVSGGSLDVGNSTFTRLPNHDSNRHPNSDSNRHPSPNTLPDPNLRNEAERGGALLISGGTVVVNNSSLADNRATGGEGGAIYVEGTSATLQLADKTEITGSADSITSPNPNFNPDPDSGPNPRPDSNSDLKSVSSTNPKLTLTQP